MPEPDDGFEYLDLTPCPRCGRAHLKIRFSRFTSPPRITLNLGAVGRPATHYGFCPSNNEPLIGHFGRPQQEDKTDEPGTGAQAVRGVPAPDA